MIFNADVAKITCQNTIFALYSAWNHD